MPPRSILGHVQSKIAASKNFPPIFLLPFLQQQTRSASIISSLSDVQSAYNKRIRRGRGPSSGKGKTSGRGHKGQGQRKGTLAGFQGGQTVDEVVRGTKGVETPFVTELSPINLDTIQSWIDQKRLDPTHPITLRELAKSRAIHGVKVDGIKLLARGAEKLTSPVNIIASRASASAIAAVEAAGGTVTTRYYTQSAIKRIMNATSHPYASLAWKGPDHLKASERASNFKYRLPDPVGRKDLEYYRDKAHRGYLAYQVGEGESPSLFFQAPEQAKKGVQAMRTKRGKTKGEVGSNRIW